MKAPRTVLLRDVINELAQALQTAIGFAAQVRTDAEATAADARQLEAAIARAVAALKRLEPAPRQRRRR